MSPLPGRIDAVTAPLVPYAAIRAMAVGYSYERGVEYARDGAVRRVSWDEPTRTLTGLVAGSARQLYRATIRLQTADAVRISSTRCSCPVGEGCKHAVATLLRSNAGAGSEVVAPAFGSAESLGAPAGPDLPSWARPAPPSPPPAPPGWRDVLLAESAGAATGTLALGFELRLREPAAVTHWGPRRVRTAIAADLAQPGADFTLGVRPMTRSIGTGNWIRSEVSWDFLRRDASRHRADQRAWFIELYGIAHDARLFGSARDASEWLTLDTVTSTLLWPLLRGAAERGIPLVPAAKKQAVTLAGEADVAIRVDDGAEGAWRLVPEVEIDDAAVDTANVRPIGRSGVYAVAADGAGLRVTLAPATLSDGIHALLTADRPVIVPAEDAEAFALEAYPRLRRDTVVRVPPSITMPEPDPTSLALTVAFRAGDVVDYRLEWVRDGHGRAAWDEHVEGDGVERELRAAVAEAWRFAPEFAFAPARTLIGLEAAEFVAHVLPALEAVEGIRVETRGKRRAYRELSGDPRITVKTMESDDADWFDLGVIVEIGGRSIPFRPLFTALATRQKKLLLSDGGYFSLAHPALDRLRDLIAEAGELAEWDAGARISRYQMPWWEDFEDLADEAQPSVAWRAAAQALRSAGTPAPTPVPAGLHAQLRPYQREGLDRLALWWRHRLGGILADDMGLGKTLQVLALLTHAREGGEKRPFLVVAPTSVLATWRDEAARFAPDLQVTVQEKTTRTRDVALADADVVVTSYTLLRLDEDTFTAVDWAIVVLDEAQFVKNPRTRLHQAVAGLRSDMVLAVTGTPLENTLTELWAILSLACPGLFPSARRFRDQYVKPIEQGKVPENEEGAPYRERRLARLRARLHPFLLRRTKELVAPELPDRQEQELHVELSPAHRAFYDTVLQRERQKVLGLLDDLDRNRFIVFRSLTLLRRLALAPALVDAEPVEGPGIRSSKLDTLRELLGELVAEGHRALVFSQFTSYLDLVRADLEAHGVAYEYLDGSTRRRADVGTAFRTGTAPVFLISLKAGGFGLTLTEADYVFLLDPWWNPAAEAQAIDRTHRIGQTRPVNVYRLIAAGTIEQKVLALQQRKARLFASVMGDDDLLARSLTADDIRGLLET